jgi:hypothetical protein
MQQGSSDFSMRRGRGRPSARDMLHSIIDSVGFGKSDYDNTIVEQEIARHLDLAYELLSMVILADELLEA